MKDRVHFSDFTDTPSNRRLHRLEKGRYTVDFDEKNGKYSFFTIGVRRNTQRVGKLVITRISIGP